MPVLLGAGSRLFHEIDAVTSLRLLSSTPYPNGLVILRYART